MKIAIGGDHAAIHAKSELVEYLRNAGHEVTDYGYYEGPKANYPVYASKVCKAIQNNDADLGVLICGTGIGMSMAANKFVGIRAAVCSESLSARLTRAHNNANVLCMGCRIVGIELMKDMLNAFLNTEFDGGRHLERINMIADIELEQAKLLSQK